MVSAVAMSLYIYNVDAGIRARRLYEHFAGDCCEMPELIKYVDDKNWATEMPWPTAVVYLDQAMARYGQEAANRVMLNSL